MPLNSLQAQLSSIGQSKVLRFWDQLPESGRNKLAAQLQALELGSIAELIETQVKNKQTVALPHEIAPVQAYPREPGAEHRQLYQKADARGRELLKQGKVGAFLVAGGQGTRLGYDGPKGEYQVTPIKKKPLFQVFAEQLRAWGRDAGRAVPWYIMTSDANDVATRAFFERHNYFGL